MHELDGFSVLLVDDHPLFREGLVLALRQRAPRLRINAVGALEEAIGYLQRHGDDVDLLLLDFHLPVENGLVSALRLRKLFPQVASALISGVDDSELPHRARESGLMGYFPKSLDVQGLLSGIALLARGETCFQLHAVAAVSSGLDDLTPRQREVLRMVASGATNKEIAQILQIAPHTVKNHLAQIFERLGASNRAQAASLARELRDV